MEESQKVTRRIKQKLEKAIQNGLKDLVTERGIYAVSVGKLVNHLVNTGLDEEIVINQIKEMHKDKKLYVAKSRVERAFEVVKVPYLQRKIRPYPTRKRIGRQKKTSK